MTSAVGCYTVIELAKKINIIYSIVCTQQYLVGCSCVCYVCYSIPMSPGRLPNGPVRSATSGADQRREERRNLHLWRAAETAAANVSGAWDKRCNQMLGTRQRHWCRGVLCDRQLRWWYQGLLVNQLVYSITGSRRMSTESVKNKQAMACEAQQAAQQDDQAR